MSPEYMSALVGLVGLPQALESIMRLWEGWCSKRRQRRQQVQAYPVQVQVVVVLLSHDELLLVVLPRCEDWP